MKKNVGRPSFADTGVSHRKTTNLRLLHRSTYKSTKPRSKPLAQLALKIPIFHP